MITGIVIITWNSEEVIGSCLDACLQLPEVEILVVDNYSEDGTVSEVKRRQGVRLIANTTNRGFAAGANQGLQALSHPAVLLLNPDALPLEGVAELAAAAVQPGVGAVGGQLVGLDGRSQWGFNVRAFPTPGILAAEVLGLNRLLPSNRWNTDYRGAEDRMGAESGTVEVDQPAGAFLMINRAAWEQVGGFDEGFYPVWFEDVDFCRRLHDCGYRVLYWPAAKARHVGGHSASRLNWDQRQLFWYGSLLRYTSKHFTPAGIRLVSAALILACLPRAILAVASGQRPRTARVYTKVFRRAWAALRHPAPVCVAASSSREENRARQFHS